MDLELTTIHQIGELNHQPYLPCSAGFGGSIPANPVLHQSSIGEPAVGEEEENREKMGRGLENSDQVAHKESEFEGNDHEAPEEQKGFAQDDNKNNENNDNNEEKKRRDRKRKAEHEEKDERRTEGKEREVRRRMRGKQRVSTEEVKGDTFKTGYSS